MRPLLTHMSMLLFAVPGCIVSLKMSLPIDVNDIYLINQARGPYWENIRSDTGKISALAGPKIKQSDWLILVIGPQTALVL